ncbi:MAG: DUF1643 domain-containing protein [Phycisphaerales bacterium]
MTVLLAGPEVEKDAVLSQCRRYRYQLTRTWDGELPTVAFVGLNPSTADATLDDPTVRRCIGFARDWGFGALVLVNLFALRSTEPSKLYSAREPVGPENDRWLRLAEVNAATMVAAWGAHGGLLGRDQVVRGLIPTLKCLGRTRDGHPRHPLYLSKSTSLEEF